MQLKEIPLKKAKILGTGGKKVWFVNEYHFGDGYMFIDVNAPSNKDKVRFNLNEPKSDRSGELTKSIFDEFLKEDSMFTTTEKASLVDIFQGEHFLVATFKYLYMDVVGHFDAERTRVIDNLIGGADYFKMSKSKHSQDTPVLIFFKGGEPVALQMGVQL